MASGTIVKHDISNVTDFIKFDTGIMIAFGSESVATTQGGGRWGYRGTVTKDLTSFGFTSMLCGYANVAENAAYWDAGLDSIDNTNKTVRLTLGGNTTATKTVYWAVIGLWE